MPDLHNSRSQNAFNRRVLAQMISYEVSIGLIIIGVIISTGSLNFGDIVAAQEGDYGILHWYFIPHFPMLFLFFISALAETNRPPFDLPEAESELVAGWLSPIPGLPDGIGWMVLKMGFVFFIFAMVKAITPRYRYDQLMRLGWKVFLPMSLFWVVLVAFLAKFKKPALLMRLLRVRISNSPRKPAKNCTTTKRNCWTTGIAGKQRSRATSNWMHRTDEHRQPL